MNTRSQTADLLKGIAVLLMMQVHILELFATDTISGSSCGKVLLFLGGPPVAPVFMVILGYFIAVSKRSFRQLVIRGLKIFALGMLLNLALNLNLILAVNKGLYQVNLLHYIFGVDILQFAGIAIIIMAFLEKILQKHIVFTVLCIGISAFLGHFLLAHIPDNAWGKYSSSLFYGSVEWSYFPLFPWLCYPLTGFAFYQLKQKVDISIIHTVKIKLAAVFLFLVFLLLTFPYAVSVSSDLPAYYHHGLLFAAWTISFLGFYSFFISEADFLFGKTALSRGIKWLGKNVTLVYMIQWIIIGNTATAIYKTVSSPFCLVISFLAVLFISCALGYAILRIKEKITAS